MSAPPRLLTLTPDFPPSVGGIQLYLQRLVEHLPGWQHRVVARSATGTEPPLDVRRTRIAAGPLSNVELNGRGLFHGKAWKPDAVLCAHVVCGPAAAALASLSKTPFVFIAYADELTHRPALTRTATRFAHSTIAISRYTAGLLDPFAPAGPVHTVLPGFDNVPLAGHRASRPTIVTVARLADRYKGHDVVLEAMPRVLAALPDAHWHVVGDGALRAELQSRAHTLGVGEAVTFHGRVDDASRNALLEDSWVFVMPSRLPDRGAGGEGFGIVYLEAAAAGLPVIAGAVAGALDAVDDGVTGLLVDPTKSEAVAEALISLLSDSRRARAMGEAGRRWARNFTWGRMATEIDRALQAALDRPDQRLDRDRT